MIEGFFVKSLEVFSDERGKVMHILRSDAPFFEKFGEVYVSVVNPGFIKGWKKHLRSTQHFAVPVGNLKLVIYDDRTNSSTRGQIQELVIGIENYQLVRIPPQVWYSFSSVNNRIALIVNCTDLPHEANETIKADLSSKIIPYNWNLKCE